MRGERGTREGGGERPGERVSSEAGYPASNYIYTSLINAWKNENDS